MRDTRTCERCSHLREEHKGVAFFDPVDIEVYSARGYCFCCDCPEFVPEPDDEIGLGSSGSDDKEAA